MCSWMQGFYRFASSSLNTKFNRSWFHYRSICLGKRVSLFNVLKDQGLALVLMKGNHVYLQGP